MRYNFEFQTKSGYYFKSVESLQNSTDSAVQRDLKIVLITGTVVELVTQQQLIQDVAIMTIVTK